MKEKKYISWMIRELLVLLGMLPMLSMLPLSASAVPEFFNLTASDVRIDSVLPCFSYSQPLGKNYSDSIYNICIEYPEFVEMSKDDILRYQSISNDILPEMPVVNSYIGVSRREGTLYASFVPLVFRDGKYQKLVSFRLKINAVAKGDKMTAVSDKRQVSSNSARQSKASLAGRYADHSVLSSGTWVKVRVPETGVYQLTDAFLRKSGFKNPSKVKIYGYGGALQPEVLTGDYLSSTDDLKEVPTCTHQGRRLFHAVGPVNWTGASTSARSRNNYSDYGYYFLTDSDEQPIVVDSAEFVASFYPSFNDYHDIYEVDNYAWYHGGRNLFMNDALSIGTSMTISLPGSHNSSSRLYVNVSFDAGFSASVSVNGVAVGTMKPSTGVLASGKLSDENAKAAQSTWTCSLPDSVLRSISNEITFTQTEGGNVRLDYVVLTYDTPKPRANISSSSIPVPEYVGAVANQDRHADAAADMVIIIPSSRLFKSQAERLKQLHQTYDSLRVNIVSADELFNEFSSGTPDANAYRRYMKMLYDRAQTDADMPRYLLLFGDAAWDNRMLSSAWKSYSPSNFLLCYESDNSFSATKCYVSDDYFCLLDDGEGSNVVADKIDAAVGRLSARTEAEATVLVDKVYAYRTNAYAGNWQNNICLMGDDGDNNRHMEDAEAVSKVITDIDPSYNIKKIYWDVYQCITTSTGPSYPDVTRVVKQQMKSGALVMNYSGHGSASMMSHEKSILLSYFAESTSLRLPLWVTASCDIMPFDGQEENFGETAMSNAHGGCIAFFGTTRTVYSSYNRPLNQAFMKYVLQPVNGKRRSIGEAVRLAKNDYTTSSNDMAVNKQHYALLGDPALVLAAPTIEARIDSINGRSVSDGIQQLSAGSLVTVKGHVVDAPLFNGVVTLTLRDAEVTVTGRLNNSAAADKAIQYKDRQNIIYMGNDSVRAGKFSITFAVPKDISYSDDAAQFLIYAVNDDKTLEAHGHNEDVVLSGSADMTNDGVGPSIYCYLNSESFVNGGTVNSTPYLYAEITDKDGINVSGGGIGHDLELIIDNDMDKTYNLNEMFQYDFGDYRTGTVGYSIPELSDGSHKLLLRAWDVLNNSSTAVLDFVVNASQKPTLSSVICTKNPAVTSTQFIINHDRIGSEMNVVLEIFDTSGRKLWEKSETGVSTDQSYTIDWDLTTASGSQLQTGVYLYRVNISCNGSSKASQSKKLIVIRQ